MSQRDIAICYNFRLPFVFQFYSFEKDLMDQTVNRRAVCLLTEMRNFTQIVFRPLNISLRPLLKKITIQRDLPPMLPLKQRIILINLNRKIHQFHVKFVVDNSCVKFAEFWPLAILLLT